MARPRPPEQVHKLLDAAELVFCTYGQGGAQMSAVADHANVALGTLYHYFTGKEALLRWAMVRALRPDAEIPDDLPIGPPPGTMAEQIAPMVDLPSRFPLLHRRPLAFDSAEAGLREVVDELYRSIENARRVVDLVEAATVDDDHLAEIWFGEMVEDLVIVWADFIQELREAYGFAPLEHPQLAARFVISTCTFFARMRHTARIAASFPEDDEVRRNTVEMTVGGLLAAPARTRVARANQAS